MEGRRSDGGERRREREKKERKREEEIGVKNRERKRLVKMREKGERKGLIKKNRGNFVFTTHLLTKTIKMIIVDKNNKSP